MTTAQRLKHLLEKHGHSIRDASRISGIPRATLGRILEGSDANLEKWVPVLAGAYGVHSDSLMGGRDPRSDFEWSIRQASLRERFEFAAMTVQDRVRLTVEFLSWAHPRSCSAAHIIAAAGLKPTDVSAVLERWNVAPPDFVTTTHLIGGIQRLCGIRSAWFLFGVLNDEPGLEGIVPVISRATHPAHRSGRNGYAPLVKAIGVLAKRRLDSSV